MLVFTKDLKSEEHNGQWGVLEAYNPQRQRLQIFILKTEAEVWIKPENISIATDIDAAMKKGKEDDAKKDKEAPSVAAESVKTKGRITGRRIQQGSLKRR